MATKPTHFNKCEKLAIYMANPNSSNSVVE